MASLVTEAPVSSPSTCSEGYVECPGSFGGGCCGSNQTCGPSYLTIDGDFRDPSEKPTAVCYNGEQLSHWDVGYQWWEYGTSPVTVYNYHAPFSGQRHTPPGGGFPSRITSSGKRRLFLTYSPGVCPSDYTTATLTYNSEADVYGAFCCRSRWTLVTTPGTVFDGTSASIDYGPACQKPITGVDGMNAMTRVSDASAADVTVPADPTEYWSSRVYKTGTMQAYGIAVFFKQSDMDNLFPRPQVPGRTEIPTPTSSFTSRQDPALGGSLLSTLASIQSTITSSPTPTEISQSKSLPSGSIPGIAVGVTLAVLLSIGSIIVLYFLRRKQRGQIVLEGYDMMSTTSSMGKEAVISHGLVNELPPASPVEIASFERKLPPAELESPMSRT